jgi:hypothetical protein
MANFPSKALPLETTDSTTLLETLEAIRLFQMRELKAGRTMKTIKRRNLNPTAPNMKKTKRKPVSWLPLTSRLIEGILLTEN